MYEVIGLHGVVTVPDIGDECTIDQLIAICRAFGLTEQEQILRDDPPHRPFIFDGCSGPARERALNGADLRLACLKHDIIYFCAYVRDQRAVIKRAAADYQFALWLLDGGADVATADSYVLGVRHGGAWWPGACYGYGRM